MKKAFTIIELLVAVGLLAGLLAASGIVFKAAIDAQRAATATAEITRKLRTITDQLNADFEHLEKDGLFILAWVPYSLYPSDTNHVIDYADYTDEPDAYINFDRLVFFRTGNFHTYHQRFGDIRGITARVSYMLAHSYYNDPCSEAHNIERKGRILDRSQHLLHVIPSNSPQDFPYFGSIPVPLEDVPNDIYIYRNNNYEHDWATPADWNNADPCELDEMYTVCTGMPIDASETTRGGLVVNTDDPNSIHMLLAEGVGEFKVQIWYEGGQRWFPEVDPDRDGDLTITDYFTHPSDNERLDVDTAYIDTYRAFNRPSAEYIINIFGPALKFTFTLYDSRGIFPDGKVFTHIVYLDN